MLNKLLHIYAYNQNKNLFHALIIVANFKLFTVYQEM